MNKKLHVKLPDIVGYHYYADVFSIINRNEKYLPWLYSNYIQLYSRKLSDVHLIDFYMPDNLIHCPWLITQKLYRDTIHMLHINIIDFIKQCILSNHYVSAHVDDYYIPGTPSYKRNHHAHELFIYGYEEDRDKKVLHFADYLKGNKYEYSTVSYNNYEDAYHSHDVILSAFPVIMLQYNPDGIYDMQIDHVISMLHDYLHATNTSDQYRLFQNTTTGSYGLDIYRTIEEDLLYYEHNSTWLELRAFHLLYEHKATMTKRVLYLQGQGYLDRIHNLLATSQEITNTSLDLRNCAIKYTINGNTKLLHRLVDGYQALASQEKRFIEHLLNELTLTAQLTPQSTEV